jgi:hypothetical protein
MRADHDQFFSVHCAISHYPAQKYTGDIWKQATEGERMGGREFERRLEKNAQ